MGNVLQAVRRGLIGTLLTVWLTGPSSVMADEPKKDKAAPSGPNLRYERFRRDIEFKVADKREEQIQGILRLLDLGPDENEIPNLKFRLAELYYEKHRFFFFRSQQFEEGSERASADAEKVQLREKSQEAVEESKSWLKQALGLYEEIRDLFPRYERMPEVLFSLGQSYWSEGEAKRAIDIYAELIRVYSDSPLVSEAWLVVGEYHFGEGDVRRALKSYEKAAEEKRSRVYGFALYKQAWCYYNLSQWKRALRQFQATVVYAQLADQLSGENKIALGREAQKDYVRTYAQVGSATRAPEIIADLIGDKDCTGSRCLQLLEQLGDLWLENGAFGKASATYQKLIKLDPDNLRNAIYQARIVDLTARSGDKKKTIAQTEELKRIYEKAKVQLASGGLKGEELTQAQEDVGEAGEMAESTVRRLAQFWNREAKKTRQDRVFEDTKAMYELYLALFPESEAAYEVRFQLGDVLYKLEAFDQAANSYKAVVLLNPKGQYVVDAATDNVLAVEEHIRDLRLKSPKPADKPQPIDPQHQRLIEACDRYIQYVPPEKATKLVAVKFKAARIFYEYSHYDDALRRFEDIIVSHPAAEQAEVAANLAMDTHNLREDWKALYAASNRYLQMDKLLEGRPKLRADLLRFGDYAKFSIIKSLEVEVHAQHGDLGQVAVGFEEFYAEYPQSENADKALFNASVIWDKVGQKAKADEARKTLLKNFKDSPLGLDVAFYLAKSEEEKTEYGKAGKAFLEFARKFPKDPRARDALYNAAVFYAGTGQVKTANKLREEYLEKYGATNEGKEGAARIYFSIARDLDEAGRHRDAVKRYEEYSKKFSRTDEFWDALWRESELRREKLGQRTASKKLEDQIVGTYFYRLKRKVPLPPNAARAASQVAFLRVDEGLRDYQRLRVRTPSIRDPKPFQRSLKDKAWARDVLIRKYTAVVTQYQQAESSIASLFRIAQVWDDFVETLVGVPCPRGVPDEVCGLIKEGIEQQVAPARDSATSAYQACLAKSNELNVFTAHSTQCVRRLEALMPDTYPAIVEDTMAYEPSAAFEAPETNALLLNGYRGTSAAVSEIGKEVTR
jgi:cellulose synthase operon protein C